MDILQDYLKKKCLKFNRCEYTYATKVTPSNKTIKITNKRYDSCNVEHVAIAYIDYTNICFENLCKSSWRCYLKEIAIRFAEDIYPPKIDICVERDECEELPEWRPYPFRIDTVIYKESPKAQQCVDRTIYVEKCKDPCARDPEPVEQSITIKYYENPCEQTTCCQRKDKKRFNSHKGCTDFNDHDFKLCCGRKTTVTNH